MSQCRYNLIKVFYVVRPGLLGVASAQSVCVARAAARAAAARAHSEHRPPAYI